MMERFKMGQLANGGWCVWQNRQQGVSVALATREEAERLKSKLVKLTATDNYVIDSLTHSIPFLIPSAKELLDDIG